MKVRVINEFVDKHTGAVRNAGSLFECDKERFEEIEKSGHFVEEVIEENKPGKKGNDGKTV